MRAGLARAPAIGTIQPVPPGATITDEPLGLRSHRFAIRGTVDVEDARELERRLRDVVLGGKRTVIVDLSRVDELISSLVGVLIRTQRSLSWRNGRLLIACESAAIRHQLADLNDIFEFVDERPQRR
jgi:anti-anti-sigma regulatory factor